MDTFEAAENTRLIRAPSTLMAFAPHLSLL
jgi:hypothetical protein